jgi:hypothetical protein
MHLSVSLGWFKRHQLLKLLSGSCQAIFSLLETAFSRVKLSQKSLFLVQEILIAHKSVSVLKESEPLFINLAL